MATVAGRERNRSRPAPSAVARERRLHAEQVRGHRFVAGWGPKRSATVVPAPLRYWQYHPGGLLALALSLAVVGIWLALFAWRGGWPALRDELPVAVAAGLLLYAVNTRRATVSDSGFSVDTAGTRADPSDVVPSLLVQAVQSGRPPEDWPPATTRGGWWPGRTRVAVRHLTDDGEASFTLWARDPQALADALGLPLTR